MNFRTELQIKPSTIKVDLKDPIVTIGSCFSDDIGEKFLENKFQVLVNPFGTVYNPLSIHKLIHYAIRKEAPKEDRYIERDGIFFHYDFHSTWNAESKEALKRKLQAVIEDVGVQLSKCRFLIITYGTSWVYEERNFKDVVANCHKVPQLNFEKFLLTQKRILESFEKLMDDLKTINNKMEIIVTVSPVRHIKDTLELNSLSKSILRLSCHTIELAYSNVRYFPSYEIMMDDLRDYRYYRDDMIHPSSQAIDYIWEKFTAAYLKDEAKNFLVEWGKIKSALSHKPFQITSTAHQQFVQDTITKLNGLNKLVDVSKEIEFMRSQLL